VGRRSAAPPCRSGSRRLRLTSPRRTRPRRPGLGGGGLTVWDAFYGFRSSAHWAAAPTGVVGTGSEIIGNTSRLEENFVPLLR
jgi:hypothetical protein